MGKLGEYDQYGVAPPLGSRGVTNIPQATRSMFSAPSGEGTDAAQVQSADEDQAPEGGPIFPTMDESTILPPAASV